MHRVNRGWVLLVVYSTLARVLGVLPEPVALGAAALAGEALFHLRPDPRDMVIRNLRRVVGTETNRSSLDRWARRSFRSYARYWVEGARLASTPASEIIQRVVTDGFDYVTEAMAAGRGVVVALPHMGSWEYGGAYVAAKGIPVTAVAERIEPPALF
ncbi:MAG: LpxL/LpxP family acyltransferase, partial [Acidimicrobiales bacterium]